jgi:uncharacterized membrane protein HdeD (DUF308 family)
MMEISRYWWAVALRGVLAMAVGVTALIWPTATLSVLVLLFGVYALVDGVVTAGTALFGGSPAAGRRGWLLFAGVTGIAAGLVTLAWPGITALALLWLIAAWAIVTGAIEVVAAVKLRRELAHEWLLALCGIVSVAFGLSLAVRPGQGALAVIWLIGLFVILLGTSLLALAFRLRRFNRSITVTAGDRSSPAPA